MSRQKTKVSGHDKCFTGNHQFIVTNWQFTQTVQKANSFTCQHCLLTVEGANEVSKLRESIHEEPHN